MRYIGLIVVVLSACDMNIFGPDVRFVNQRPMAPVPAVYSEWYAATETCLGRTRDFGAVRWFVADSIVVDGRTHRGHMRPWRDATIREDHVLTEWLVRHEMAHHILRVGNDAHDEWGHLPCEFDAVS